MQLDSLQQFFVPLPPLLLLQSWLVSPSRGHSGQSEQHEAVFSILQRMLGLLQRLSLRQVAIALLPGMLGQLRQLNVQHSICLFPFMPPTALQSFLQLTGRQHKYQQPLSLLFLPQRSSLLSFVHLQAWLSDRLSQSSGR